MTEYTAAEVEGWVASLRQEIAIAPPTPGGVRTPDQILFALEHVDSVAANAVRVVKDADKLRAATAESLLRARARARAAATGKNSEERAAEVDVAVADERAAASAAQIAYRYARDVADLIDSRKSSLQTQAKLVLATYQLAGIPRRN